jgi:hypothetical protein
MSYCLEGILNRFKNIWRNVLNLLGTSVWSSATHGSNFRLVDPITYFPANRSHCFVAIITVLLAQSMVKISRHFDSLLLVTTVHKDSSGSSLAQLVFLLVNPLVPPAHRTDAMVVRSAGRLAQSSAFVGVCRIAALIWNLANTSDFCWFPAYIRISVIRSDIILANFENWIIILS